MKRTLAVVIAVVLVGLVAYILARISTPGYVQREIAQKVAACQEQGYAEYDVDADVCRRPEDPAAPPTAAPRP
jgi:hypothetical protein